jgi:ABC-type multidrug transport system fused ATPase/permease subunit
MATFKRLLGYLGPYRGRFLLACWLTFLTVVGDMLTPRLFGWTIDRGLSSGRIDQVLYYCLLLLAAAVAKAVLQYWQWQVQHQVGQDVVRDVRNELYSKLQVLPPSFYRSMPTGQIMSRLTSDVEAIQEYMGWGMILQGAGLVSFTGTALILLSIDWQLTLVVMAPLTFLAVVVMFFDKRIGPAWEAVREQMGQLTTVLQENISGVRVVKAFAKEGNETGKFGTQNDDQRQRNMVRVLLEAQAFPAMDLMIGLTFVLLAWYGAQRVIAGETTLGTFFAYQWYLWGIIWPVRFMGWMISLMRQALAAGPRIFEILDAPTPGSDRPEARALEGVRGEIVFKDVAFAFPDEPERKVLDGLNLRVAPGEVVAILGGTGSGKSSLINLIPRFYEAQGGQVLVDGQDVRQVQLKSLRDAMGIVPQESFLFSATVRDNIAYGCPDASDEQIVAAATLAQAHGFVMGLDKGYDTIIGERGIGLSGGQKQRLALARAILMDPRILILDEATSAVDTETEHEIQQALEQIMQGRTSLIIAQRLSTIKHAHRIVVLKAGRVEEEGTHEQLLALGGEYARIYNLQYREQDEMEQGLLAELVSSRKVPPSHDYRTSTRTLQRALG